MTQELLHEMQEKFPIFILIAAGLLDLSGSTEKMFNIVTPAPGASRDARGVSEILGLGFPGAAQPRAESSPAPSQGFPITQDDLDEVTLDFQSPAADPTNGTTADSVPAHTGRAANRTALLPGALAGSLEVSEPLHTQTAALKLQDGRGFPGKLLSSSSIPVSTQGSQATTPLQQPDRSLQRKPENTPGAGLPRPFPSAGTHQDSPELTAVPSPSGTTQVEVTRPKTSFLTPVVNFHPPGKETAASPFPTRVGSSPGSAEVGWLPTGFPPTTKRPRGTNPQAQPGSRAGVTPAHLKKSQMVDAGVTTPAFPPKPASGDLDAANSRTTHARDVQFSPVLSEKQETTGSRDRNSTSAVTNGSGHPTQLPVLRTLPPGHAHSSSVVMEAPVPGGSIPSPFQGPLSTTGGQQPLSLYRALNCTKHTSQETSRSPQETTVLSLQRHADHGMVTSKPGKSRTPESPQASASSSSSSQSLKLPQTTKELKEVTAAPPAGMSMFGNADLQPWDSVHEGLQPLGASFPARAELQPMSIPSSAEKGLHIPTPSSTSTASGSRVQGVSARPVPQETFGVVLQVSTQDSRRKKSLPQQAGETGSPAASPVPSPSGPRDNRSQTVPSHSLAPPASQTRQAGSLAAFASELPSPHARGGQGSSTTAHPDPVVPSVPAEVPAQLAQALVQQFRMSLAAATKNLSSARGDPLTTLPPAPYLSFLLKSTNGMICLQPMQESHLPTKFPNTSIGGLVSIQQILAASNSSLLDLASLQHLSPSSLVLVKPVFVLLSTDRADSQVVPFPQGEGEHRIAPLVPSVGTPLSIPDTPGRTSSSYPTGKSETALSTVSKQQGESTKATSKPVSTHPNYRATTGSFQAVTSGSGRFLDPHVRMSTTVQALHLHRMTEEMQIPAPRPQQAKGTDLLSLDRMMAEPITSPVPPAVMSTQQSPRASPRVSFTTEKPHSSMAPLLPARGLHDLPVPAQPLPTSTGTAGHVQHSEKLPLQTPQRGRGSVTTPTMECSTSRSAGATNHPLRDFTGLQPLQATSQRLPGTKLLLSPVVPSTSSASPVPPAGNEHREAALGSTARSGVPGSAPAAQTRITSVQPDLTQHLEFTPVVPKPFITTGRPRAAPVQLLSAEGQGKTTVPGKLLATVTHPRVYSSSAAHPPSPASAHVPLLSALNQDQTPRAPAQLFSQASVGETTKPAETSTGAGKGGAGKFLGTSVALSATFDTRTQQPLTAAPGKQLVLTAVQPSVSPGSVSALGGQPRSTQVTPGAPAAAAALSAAKEGFTTTALTGKNVLHLPTPAVQSDPDVVLPTAARVSTSAMGLASVGKGEGEAKGGTAPPSHLPTLAPMSASYQASPRHPLEKISLEDTVEQDTGHSSPGSGVRPAGPPTAAAFAVSAQRLVSKVTNQSAGFQKALVDDAEMLLGRDLIQFLPSPESPSYPPGSPVALTPQGNSSLAVASTESSGRLPLNTEAEEMGRTNDVTDGAAEGLGTVLTLLDSEPSAPSDSHQRRGLHPDVTVLNGLAVVSDDTCGSGNYTVQMSLSPAAHTAPEPHGAPAPSQETFLALVALQSNSSQALLQIHSCCVTPSASPGAPGAQCCLFHRLPFECRHIQLLQSSRSRAASFTIQLFQMLNNSVAYLHCELNICLHGKPGCEQDCFESVEPLVQPSDRNSYGNLHNLITLGPVWRMNNRFLYKPVEGPGSALLVPILLGSLAGFAVLGSAFISLWLHHRQKSKPSHYPPFGEVRGL